ncbi:MAG: hypothetical protein HON14_18935 [Rhodospirillaceae bacterium]|nr:hypothetical protein [Rhodospirillaceae bacterium]MBT4589390.1 hypothetical protein [Rhodospirillaceae bacterium]MBT4941225.1 hypothetical protein [Rhodospirillaceae bacterium]MBT7267318.1 hypothetical protein [Rhodospirillaceae bacterium]
MLVSLFLLNWQTKHLHAQSDNQLSIQNEFTCRYFGRDYNIGARICLTTPDGLRVAQCGMVLNNSAWKLALDSCQQATEKVPRTSSKAQKYLEEYMRGYGQ